MAKETRNKIKFKGEMIDLFDIIPKEDVEHLKYEKSGGGTVDIGELISKRGIKRLRDHFKLEISFIDPDKFLLTENGQPTEQFIESPVPIIKTMKPIAADADVVYYTWCKVAGEGKEPVYEVGEICASGASKNTSYVSQKYIMAMLFKRAYGRAVLDFLELHDFMAEDEMDGAKEAAAKEEATGDVKTTVIKQPAAGGTVYKCMGPKCGAQITRDQYLSSLKTSKKVAMCKGCLDKYMASLNKPEEEKKVEPKKEETK